jgi:hypothetical protein
MTINKFKVFTWDRILLYILPPVLLAVALLMALVNGTTPLVGYILLTITIAAWSFMSFMLFDSRYDFAKQIATYTTDGTGLVPSYFTITDQQLADINAAQTEVVNFWCSKLLKSPSTFIDYMNGGMLTFTKNKIDMTQHAPTGPLAYAPVSKWAIGATQGNWSTVTYSGNEADWETTLKAIKHEFGHVCLNAAGYEPLMDQHPIMKQYEFPY